MPKDLRFDGRTALVTGAGRGLGRAYALLLASRGARVVVNDLGAATDGTLLGEDRAAAVAAEIEKSGGEAVANTTSVATPEGGREIVECALEAYGSLDVVVNNAGHKGGGAFVDYPDDAFDAILQAHLRGSVSVTRAAWPHMLERGYGRVVFTASAAALGLPGASAYSAAKAGVLGLTRTLALETGDRDLKVNAILPMARTPGNQGISNASLGRYLDDFFPPDLVAPAVALLAHESCPWNGETLTAGGGRVARVTMGITPGYYDPALSPESLAANAAAVVGLDGAQIARSFADDVRMHWPHHPWPGDEDLLNV